MSVALHPLDDPALMELDREGMFGHIGAVGPEFVRAWDGSANLSLPGDLLKCDHIVVCGVGGSATAADYFAALAIPQTPIPIRVVRSYALPNFVASRSLVVVCSYSGNTEEMLSIYEDARQRGAHVAVITRGGKLGEWATRDPGVVCWPVSYASPPRAAMVHSLAPLLRLGTAAGTLRLTAAEVARAAACHQETAAGLAPSVGAAENVAKRLAAALVGRIPVVVAAQHLAPAGLRFRNQLAENGKTLAISESLPEMGHNLVVGLSTAPKHAGTLALITLESPALYHPRIQRRFELIAAQFEGEGIPVHRLRPAGEAPLDQLLSATAWGDYVSCYLALLNGFDPTPIPQIETLRSALEGQPGEDTAR